MRSFKKYALFSNHERVLIFFLIGFLLLGTGINLLKRIQQNENKAYEVNFSEIQAQILNIPKPSDENYIEHDAAVLPKLCIDVNLATREKLEQLPHIGPVLSQRILDYRKKVGHIQKIDELINIKGIGNKKLDQLRPYIKITNKYVRREDG